MVLKSIAKKEFALFLRNKSENEVYLFADFFYEGVLTFRELKRKVQYVDMSAFLHQKIVSEFKEIVSNDNRLAKVLGFLYEFFCEKLASGHVSSSECEQLIKIFEQLKKIPRLTFHFYISVLVSVINVYGGRRPKGLEEPHNPHLTDDCKKILSVLT